MSGWVFEKLLISNGARKKTGRISAPVGVKLLIPDPLALVDKIEFSAENAMVGLVLFGAREGQTSVLGLSTKFEFLCRKKTTFLLSLGMSCLYVPVSYVGQVQDKYKFEWLVWGVTEFLSLFLL